MKALKLVSLVLAVLLALTLVVSCSNNGEENSKPAGESNTEQPSGEDSVPAESSEEVSRGPLDHLDYPALNGLTNTFLDENGAICYTSVEYMPKE